jgi:hypothetical protein
MSIGGLVTTIAAAFISTANFPAGGVAWHCGAVVRPGGDGGGGPP